MRRILAVVGAVALAAALSYPVADARPHRPRPSPSPTLSPSPSPSPAPTPSPSPSPSSSCGTSLQSLITGTPTGGTLVASACVYHEAVTVSRAMTISGPATIDGDGVRAAWITVTAPDVTVDGLTMRNAAAGAIQSGSLNVDGGARFHLRNATLAGGGYADLRLWFAPDSIIETSDIGTGRAIGIVSWASDRAIVRGNRIHDNNATRVSDPGIEAGGVKFGNTIAPVIANNELDHNLGPGAWVDVACSGASITGNRAHHNARSGLMVEITDGATVTGNTVYRNGFDPTLVWGWPAGILISSSRNVTVSGNTVAYQPVDISIVGQARDPRPHDGISVTNNIVRAADPSTVAIFTDSGDVVTAVIAPNTLVADSDPRLAGL